MPIDVERRLTRLDTDDTALDAEHEVTQRYLTRSNEKLSGAQSCLPDLPYNSTALQQTRLDTDDTILSVGEEKDQGQATGCSNEKLPRFSDDQVSYHDLPYDSTPRRRARISFPKRHSLIPGQGEFEEPRDVPWHCGVPHRFNTPQKDDSWERCFKLTEKYDNEMCDAWKDEVDKLLIFAGLFSATVTAFTIESYKWLAEDSNDVSNSLLAFIALQVANSTTSIPPGLLPPPFSISASQVRINAVWFLSLTLSLTTVLIGILCLQWLREYQRDAALPHKDAVALRQMRYEGLLYWRVPEILSALPILLQSALVLFFIGVLDLLWDRHTVVAVCISVACAIVMLFLAATTAIPALQHAFTEDTYLRVPQCPYKSPQSWLCYRSGHFFFMIISSFNVQWSIPESPRFLRFLKSVGDLDWLTFDVRWRQFRDAQEVVRGTAKNLVDHDDIAHGLQWINATFSQSVEAVYPIYHGIADIDIDAAEKTISGFYQDGQIDNATLRVMLDNRFSPADDQKRDILSVYYLRLHQGTHPVLRMSYIETVIRILNSQDVPRPFYDWLSEILQELGLALRSSMQPDSKHSLLDPEIIVQVLLCIKNIIPRRHGLQTSDVVVAWALLHRLLAPPFAALNEETGIPIHLNKNHLILACGLFEELDRWITSSKETERLERVKLCAEGMLVVFSNPALNISRLCYGLCPELTQGVSLMHTLDLNISTYGGTFKVLSCEGWLLNYCDAYYDANDWERLVQKFEVLNAEPC